MSHFSRLEREINGIAIGMETVRLLQYADDTVIFLDGYEKA